MTWLVVVCQREKLNAKCDHEVKSSMPAWVVHYYVHGKDGLRCCLCLFTSGKYALNLKYWKPFSVLGRIL